MFDGDEVGVSDGGDGMKDGVGGCGGCRRRWCCSGCCPRGVDEDADEGAMKVPMKVTMKVLVKVPVKLLEKVMKEGAIAVRRRWRRRR